MLHPAFWCETRHKCVTVSQRGWHGIDNSTKFVESDSIPFPIKSLRFHLCLLHFLFLTSSRQNWNWQGNYHFILNWSQSMWAGSKHRDTRGGKKRDGGGKKSILGAFGDGSVICKTYRLKGGERWKERSREGEKEGETFGDCVAGVPLMSPWQEPDWEPHGVGALAFYSSGSAGFFLAWAGPVLRRCGPLVEPACSLSENNKCLKK